MVVSDAAKTRLLAAILSAGSISRTQLAERTGLSPSRVTKVVNPLLASGVIEEVAVSLSGTGPGRPRRMLAVKRDRSSVVGIKLSPSGVTGVLTDMESRTLAHVEHRLRGHKPEPAMRAMQRVCEELLAHPAAEGIPPVGVGVGVGGHVDSQLGLCVHSGIMGWRGVGIADRLTAETGLPVVVNNDVNALAVAQHWFGAGREVDSFAVITVGLGVGCGLILNGRLHSGVSGLAGEFGHLPLVPNGPQCTCGNRGCIEAVASYPAILRFLQDNGISCRSIEQAIRLAQHDGRARAAFAAAGHVLGTGLATLCNLLNLEKVILSGEGVIAYELFRPELERAWRAHSFSTAADDCEFVVDDVQPDVWAKGAACLAIQDVVTTARF